MFYRPNLYTIQFAFEYENKISTDKIADGIHRLIKRMPVIGARIERASAFRVTLTSGHKIPVREQSLASNSSDLPNQLFDTVSNVENEPLIKVLISHMGNRTFVGVIFSHMLGDGSAFFIFMQELSVHMMNFHQNLSQCHFSNAL